MFAILYCVNAQDVLKKLKLTGCVKITGRGLSPLRESVVLEQIDLKKYEDPWNSNGRLKEMFLYLLSKEVILQILDSIISTSGCSLKHILLPYNWKSLSNTSFGQFVNRYNQSFDNRGISCSNCAETIQGNQWFLAQTMFDYNTCYI